MRVGVRSRYSEPAFRAQIAAAALALLLSACTGSANSNTPSPSATGGAGLESPPGQAASTRAYVRVNLVGYLPAEPKRAVLMSRGGETGATFSVIAEAGGAALTRPIGPNLGAWSTTFPHTYALDFSSVSSPGSYFIRVDGPLSTTSPVFRIDGGAILYGPLVQHALAFYELQRDGPNVDRAILRRQPSHLTDRRAFVYRTPGFRSDVLQGKLVRIGGPVDVSGGWFDAGDYLKFVETTSYTEAVMLLRARDQASGGPEGLVPEARFGLDWLQKMWDERTKTLYYQVGIGDGNGCRTICGDHDVWRLPQADDALKAKRGSKLYYVKYRPVFRAGRPGSLISPNLAGRLAADFALCFQVYRAVDEAYADHCLKSAEDVFALAKTTNVGPLVTAAPFDFYPETEWRDDMELGAAELSLATAAGPLPPGLPHPETSYYLRQAARWARAYLGSPQHGSDSLNLYDDSALAHGELYRALQRAGRPTNLQVTRKELLADLKGQLDAGLARAGRDPFGLGFGYTDGDVVPHALGYAETAAIYDGLTGTRRYAGFTERQLGFVLGDNAWGSSFVVGAGSTFPHCMQHQVANLAGSLDGSPPVALGATVDGPTSADNLQGLGGYGGFFRPCLGRGKDVFRRFSGRGARYMDDVRAWPTVEPSLDYTALSLLVFGREAAG